nr:ribonuclease E/G [Ramlibacter sp.]
RQDAPAGQADEQAAALASAGGSVGAVIDMGDQQMPAADAVLESHTHRDGQRSEPEGDERREPRSRDRYGRDRRERQPRDDVPAASSEPQGTVANEAVAPPDQQREDRADRPRYPTGFVTEEVQGASQAPELPQQAAIQPSHPAPGQGGKGNGQARPAKGLPAVQPFDLPVTELASIAEGSGLQWVNSDAGKIAAVQAAIAAEPRAPRVPRERPASVRIDDGPLVLVETRRDLQGLKLPFEQGPQPLQ